jgi:hypothetical protein
VRHGVRRCETETVLTARLGDSCRYLPTSAPLARSARSGWARRRFTAIEAMPAAALADFRGSGSGRRLGMFLKK